MAASTYASAFADGWYWVWRDGAAEGEYVYITHGMVLRVGQFARQPAAELRNGYVTVPVLAPPPVQEPGQQDS